MEHDKKLAFVAQLMLDNIMRELICSNWSDKIAISIHQDCDRLSTICGNSKFLGSILTDVLMQCINST